MHFKYSVSLIGCWILLSGCTPAENPEDPCIPSAKPTCYIASAGQICDDSKSVDAVCGGTTWSCPTGSLARESCRCGVPPNGDCLKDGGTPDGVPPDVEPACSAEVASQTPCFSQTTNGICSDVGGTWAECTDAGIACRAGYALEKDCRCGVPPRGDCLRDSGTCDADASKPWCFAVLPNGLCTDVISGDPVICSNGQWACKPGTIPMQECPCGVPPRGDCLRDSGTCDADAAKPWCFAVLPNGLCTDVISGDPVICSNGQWACKPGTIPMQECPCGVPPSGDCLRDGGDGG